MKAGFTRWGVLDRLRTEDARMAYLHAAYEEDPGDGSLMRAALDDVTRARKAALPGRSRETKNPALE